LIADYNDLSSVETLCRANPGAIAAVIVEPIAANMGVVPPAAGFLDGLRALCDSDGMILIFDEVVSGFRLGTGGAQALYDVQPDLTCLGKIIGGGLPVGAYGGRADLMDQVAPAGPVYQAGTLSGNPLRKLSTTLYRHLEKLRSLVEVGLADGARAAGVPLQINGVGSMFTPFFSDRPVTNYVDATTADTEAYAAFFRGMLARGIYPPPSQFEAWFLSAAHTERDIDRTISAARAALKEIRAR
jgi:glutamate-1-semialdehyde 2,1-aminomutase